MNNAPLGVFDSGIGGLTVARALFERLPHESVIYFGDTARVPYGPKSPDTVRRYSAEILAYLLHRGVKAVVVACNTSTAHALGYLQSHSSVPVVGVIEPGARAAVAATRTGTIGVIGTAGTIASGAYERAIKALRPDARVYSQPCPLFVPLVEEGWFEHPAAELIARDYLAPLQRAKVDVLVLGCTHYPLLKPLLAQVMAGRPDVKLVDSAEETATAVSKELERLNLLANGSAHDHRFVAGVGRQRTRMCQRLDQRHVARERKRPGIAHLADDEDALAAILLDADAELRVLDIAVSEESPELVLKFTQRLTSRRNAAEQPEGDHTIRVHSIRLGNVGLVEHGDLEHVLRSDDVGRRCRPGCRWRCVPAGRRRILRSGADDAGQHQHQ